MEDAYRDRSVAATARLDALESEIAQLKEEKRALERERDLARSRSERTPVMRHRGWLVVLGLVGVIGSILGSALWIALTLTTHDQTAPSAPSAPPNAPRPPS